MIYAFVLAGFALGMMLFACAAWGSAWLLVRLFAIQEGDEYER